MIIDISNQLHTIITKKSKWNRQKFIEIVLFILRRNAKSWVQWDEDSGELWARVLLGDKVIAIISSVQPIALLAHSFNEQLVTQLEDDIVVIKFHEYDGQEFSLDPEVYYKLFGERWRTETSDIMRFSAHDLYFQSST
jgi:hypothetical protein